MPGRAAVARTEKTNARNSNSSPTPAAAPATRPSPTRDAERSQGTSEARRGPASRSPPRRRVTIAASAQAEAGGVRWSPRKSDGSQPIAWSAMRPATKISWPTADPRMWRAASRRPRGRLSGRGSLLVNLFPSAIRRRNPAVAAKQASTAFDAEICVILQPDSRGPLLVCIRLPLPVDPGRALGGPMLSPCVAHGNLFTRRPDRLRCRHLH